MCAARGLQGQPEEGRPHGSTRRARHLSDPAGIDVELTPEGARASAELSAGSIDIVFDGKVRGTLLVSRTGGHLLLRVAAAGGDDADQRAQNLKDAILVGSLPPCQLAAESKID